MTKKQHRSTESSEERTLSAKALFHNRGFKCTPQRLAVLRALEQCRGHMAISEIHAKVRDTLPGTGLATVYRALETLINISLVVKVHLEDNRHSYSIAPEGHRHPVVCVECSSVVEFAECPLQDIADAVSKRTGFLVERHFLQLFGRCQKCRL
ncbi:MAG: Fur family transcriptional regulator [Deltaproteobacteria bacterium]